MVTVYVFGIGTHWFGSVVPLCPVGALAAVVRSVVVAVDGFAAAAVFVVDVLAAAVVVVHVAAALVAVDVPAAAAVHAAAVVVVVIVGIETAAVVGFAYALAVRADAACAGEENLVVIAVMVVGGDNWPWCCLGAVTDEKTLLYCVEVKISCAAKAEDESKLFFGRTLSLLDFLGLSLLFALDSRRFFLGGETNSVLSSAGGCWFACHRRIKSSAVNSLPSVIDAFISR